jgi:hypothetical protein
VSSTPSPRPIPPPPALLTGRPEAERQQWARWVLGSHSDQFIPEMVAAVEALDQQDPIAYGVPIVNPGPRPDDLVVITSERGRHGVVMDQPLPCRVVLLDFTGTGFEPGSNPHGWQELSVACSGMGQVLDTVWQRLDRPPHGCYLGVLCDDVMLRSSDVVTLLALARLHDLPALQPSVVFNAELSAEYGFLRQRACVSMHRVPMVEVMAPFLRRDLLDLAMPFNAGTVSAYGLDRFVFPLCAAHLGQWRFASVDLTPMTHIRRGRTLRQRHANGLLSKEEEYLVRQRLMLAMGFDVDQTTYQQLEQAVQVRIRHD